MIIFNSSAHTSLENFNKYQEHIGFGHNHSKKVKVKTSSSKKLCEVGKRRLTKKKY